jgi:AraC-like DNA-binding protein
VAEGEWDAEVAEARSYRWEPLREICREFGIAQRKLSTFCHEALGMSATEMVDAVKAETVRGRMKRELKEWMIEESKKEKGKSKKDEQQGEERSVKERAVEVFEALKKWRRNRWHRATWAMEHGFGSYQRMFRGCLHVYEMTPHELEVEVIEEILREGEREEHHRDTEAQRTTEKDEGVKGEVKEEVAGASS